MKILNKEAIDTLRLNEDGTAKVTIIAVPIRNQEVGYASNDGYSKMNITSSFADKLMLSFNKRRRTAFGLGKPKNIPLLWEHQQNIDNVLGTVYSDIRKENLIIEGEVTSCLTVDVLITDQDVVKDIVTNGRNANSSVSIGADVSDLDNPILQEISLVEKPALKDAVLLSNKEQSFYNLESDKKTKILKLSEEIQDLKMDCLANNLRIQEIEKEKEIEKELNLVIDNSFSQNQITKEHADNLKNSLKLSNVMEVRNIEKVLKKLPKNILNLSNRFGRY